MVETEPIDQSDRRWRDDPSLLRSRREAIFIAVLWTICFFYSVTYCYLFGYLSHEPMPEKQSFGPDIGALVGPLESFNRKPESLTFVFGIPDWVFYGVIAPWIICLIVTVLFCAFFFAEDDLGHDPDTSTIGED